MPEPQSETVIMNINENIRALRSFGYQFALVTEWDETQGMVAYYPSLDGTIMVYVDTNEKHCVSNAEFKKLRSQKINPVIMPVESPFGVRPKFADDIPF
jgi:hypothetical protein